MNQAELTAYKQEITEIAIEHLETAIADYRAFLAGTYQPIKFFVVSTPPTLDGMLLRIIRASESLRVVCSRSDADWQAVHTDALSESY